MGTFSTNSLKVEQLSKYEWKTLQEFVFYYGLGSYVTVPEGTVTDFASVPRFLWGMFPPIGKYTQASVVHDFLVTEGKLSWKECADVFLEAMITLEVSKWRRDVMYFFVRAYGVFKTLKSSKT